MHICFLTHEYPPGQHGGIGSFTQTLGRGLANHRHRITVVGNYPRDQVGVENDQGVHVIRVPNFRVPKAAFIVNTVRLRRALFKIQKEYPIDILEGPNLTLGLLPRSFPASKVLRIHTTISTEKKPKFLRSWLIRRSFDFADCICAVSHSSAETNRFNLELGNCSIEVIPNPVDTLIFHHRPIEEEKEGLILFVGTVCENKGIRQLIGAMPEIVDAVPSAKLWVVGRDWPDPETGEFFTARLRGLIPHRLSKHIFFKGAVDHSQMPKIISQAQICVYPSHMENMPVSWLEGMAMGKAIVASNTGPGPDIVEDAVSGLLCDPYDPASIAENVVQLLKNPDLRHSLGKQAHKRVVELFSLDVLAERNEAFYRRCIATKTASSH